MAVAITAGAACSGADDAADAGRVPTGFSAERCLVQLHGRSEDGAVPRRLDGYAVLRPGGNEANPTGSGRVWLYRDDDEYAEALAQVTEVVDAAGCTQVVLHGFSNGGGFLGNLLCRGETLDGRLVGAVVDDPVPDDSSPCTPDPSVPVSVFWTGGLEEATAGAQCDELGWTCSGSGVLVGIDEFARRLGAAVAPSIHTDHRVYDNPPEIHDWLAGK